LLAKATKLPIYSRTSERAHVLHETETSPGSQLKRNLVRGAELNETLEANSSAEGYIQYGQLAEPGLQGLQLPAGCVIQLDLTALPRMRYTV
jgi:hypothetical protein